MRPSIIACAVMRRFPRPEMQEPLPLVNYVAGMSPGKAVTHPRCVWSEAATAVRNFGSVMSAFAVEREDIILDLIAKENKAYYGGHFE
ncbi:hypothetical protein F862_gp008 [Vibrio phage vB_VpaS_MAR10]|uniref:Uncharacterized protein n=1 Tax=Vibrio phage vB_VpaS_MAR10 TaxID=1229755 RepID=K7R9B4_9CAUD|nr:hypothetical protein F862_gp008 [Vibrio phage vB_VpaS_MAR10]AFV81238.1 hypothetical protein MAR10_006 [Vibrio phage vB_VpaS_MAR10]